MRMNRLGNTKTVALGLCFVLLVGVMYFINLRINKELIQAGSKENSSSIQATPRDENLKKIRQVTPIHTQDAVQNVSQGSVNSKKDTLKKKAKPKYEQPLNDVILVQ